MPYLVKANGAGPWLQGQIVPDAEFEAHAAHAKFLRNQSVVQVSDADAAPHADPAEAQARIAEIDAQIGQLQAERQAVYAANPALLTQLGLQGVTLGPEPTAPAQVAYAIQPADQPSGAEADATRAAGNEVIQPTPGPGVAVGVVVPGEAAADPPADESDDKKGRK